MIVPKIFKILFLMLIALATIVHAQGRAPGRLVVSVREFTSDDIKNRKTIALVDPQTRCIYLGVGNFENTTAFLNQSQNWHIAVFREECRGRTRRVAGMAGRNNNRSTINRNPSEFVVDQGTSFLLVLQR